jgi:hypothetical protein
MNTTGSSDASGPNPALMSALTTEHYTLQFSCTATIVEANGRSMLFLSSVSGATVVLALVAQLDRMGDTFVTFALTVLPALLALGLTSYARLADLAVHDAYYARAVGRIRAFYLTIEPSTRQYWLVPAGDDGHAVMRQVGQPHSRWHHLGHTATAVAAVDGVITGAFLGVLGSAVTPLAAPVLASAATITAVGAFAGLLADQERRWRRSDASLESHFLPDGTPPPWLLRRSVTAPPRTEAAPHSPLLPVRTAPGQKQARPPAEPERNRRPGTPEARPQTAKEMCSRWLLHRPPKKRLAGGPRPP